MYVQPMYIVIIMNIEDVKRDTSQERRNVRINIRITRSQDKFVQENNLSFTKIFDSALKQLGYIEPSYSDLEKEDKIYLKDSFKERYRTSKRRIRR